MSKVITVVNQKGGVGKTTTAINVGIGLVNKGYKVLLVDVDSQGSLTAALGIKQPDQLKEGTIGDIIYKNIRDVDYPDDYGILRHEEGVDFIPSNTVMASVELEMQSAYSREHLLDVYIDRVRDNYDYILIDCPGSLGIVTVNALTCADSVLIPAQPQFLTSLAIQQLFESIALVRKKLNKSLAVEGILFTMTTHTCSSRDIMELLTKAYGKNINVFASRIPSSVRASEATAKGISIYRYYPECKVSLAYQQLVDEILGENVSASDSLSENGSQAAGSVNGQNAGEVEG